MERRKRRKHATFYRLYKKAEDLPSETEVRLRHQQALNAERMVIEGGGKFKGIAEGIRPGEVLVWFDNSFPPYTTGFLPLDGLTVEKVKAQVEAANARMKNKAQEFGVCGEARALSAG